MASANIVREAQLFGFDLSRTTHRAQDTEYSKGVKAIEMGYCPNGCPIRLWKRKKFCMGTKVIHEVCPLCFQKHLRELSPSQATQQCNVLLQNYDKLTDEMGKAPKDIRRMKQELAFLKEEFQNCNSTDSVDTKEFAIGLAKVLEVMETKVDEILQSQEKDEPPSSLEQLQSLRTNMEQLEIALRRQQETNMELQEQLFRQQDTTDALKRQSAAAMSFTSEDALLDVLAQLEQVKASLPEQESLVEQQHNEFQEEVNKLQIDLLLVQRTMSHSTGRVSELSKNVGTLNNRFTSLKDEMRRKHAEYDREIEQQKVLNEEFRTQIKELFEQVAELRKRGDPSSSEQVSVIQQQLQAIAVVTGTVVNGTASEGSAAPVTATPVTGTPVTGTPDMVTPLPMPELTPQQSLAVIRTQVERIQETSADVPPAKVNGYRRSGNDFPAAHDRPPSLLPIDRPPSLVPLFDENTPGTDDIMGSIYIDESKIDDAPQAKEDPETRATASTESNRAKEFMASIFTDQSRDEDLPGLASPNHSRDVVFAHGKMSTSKLPATELEETNYTNDIMASNFSEPVSSKHSVTFNTADVSSWHGSSDRLVFSSPGGIGAADEPAAGDHHEKSEVFRASSSSLPSADDPATSTTPVSPGNYSGSFCTAESSSWSSDSSLDRKVTAPKSHPPSPPIMSPAFASPTFAIIDDRWSDVSATSSDMGSCGFAGEVSSTDFAPIDLASPRPSYSFDGPSSPHQPRSPTFIPPTSSKSQDPGDTPEEDDLPNFPPPSYEETLQLSRREEPLIPTPTRPYTNQVEIPIAEPVPCPTTERSTDNSSAIDKRKSSPSSIVEKMKDVPEILSIMYEFPDDVDVQAAGCSKLGNLAIESKVKREMIVNGGGVRLVLSALQGKHRNVPIVLENGMFALVNMSYGSPDSRNAIVDFGGLYLVMDALHAYPNHAGVQKNGLLAIGNLINVTADTRNLIVRKNGIRLVLSALKAHPDVTKIQQYGWLAIGHLAHSSPENKERVVTGGGIDLLLATIKAYQGTSGVLRKCLLVLANLAAGNAEHRASIVESDGIELILDTLRTYPREAEILQHGLLSLANIAAGTAENKIAIVDAGAIDLTVTALRTHTNSVGVQKRGLLALGVFAFNDSSRAAIAKAGGIDAVLSAMRQFPDNAEVQRWGCRAIKMLSQTSRIQRKFKKKGAVELVANAVKRHPNGLDGYGDDAASELQRNGSNLLSLGKRGSKSFRDKK